jgi:lipopolysaccharide transport system ATP-binding protein
MAVIQALCTRGVVLQAGRVAADAPVNEAIALYLGSLEQASEVDLLERTDRSGWHDIMVSGLSVSGPDGGVPATGAAARFAVTLTGLQPGTKCTLTVLNNLGQPVCRLESGNVAPGDVTVTATSPDTPAVFVCDIPALPLLPGRYRVDVQVRGTHQIQDQIDTAVMFDVESGVLAGRPVSETASGDVMVEHRWTVPTLD